MPAFATHLFIAQRVLSMSQNQTHILSRGCGPAFLRGALAPDMGYFADSERFPSDLAHYVSTADLLQSLYRVSTAQPHTAFANGWLTHFLVDCTLHPFINLCVGEALGRPAGEPVSYEQDPKEHLRVELGLDAALLASLPPEDRPIFPSGFDSAADAAQLSRAYRLIYQLPLGHDLFAHAESNFAREGKKLFQCAEIYAALWSDQPIPESCRWFYWTQLAPLQSLGLLLGKRTPHYGVVKALKPTDEQFLQYRTLVDQVIEESLRRVQDGELPKIDRNLDTGGDARLERDYPLLRKATEELLDRQEQGR